MAIKGSATGTMNGMDTKPTEMERLAKEAADTAKSILDAYSGPPEAVDAEKTLAPLEEAIKATPAPADLPLPSAPSGGNLFGGLLATNLAAVAARNPNLATLGLETATNRIAGREQVQRANTIQRNQADAERQLAFLSLREKILTEKLAGEKAGSADKTAKELFVVKTALDHVTNTLGERAKANMSREELAAQERIAKMESTFRFLGTVLGMDQPQAGGGMDPKNEIDEITKLNDFTTQIDLKLNPEGTWTFKKVPSDEEMTSHVRIINSYLSSPSQRVRGAALFNLKNMLQAKFGNDQAAKQKFLIENGLVAKPEGQ